MQTPPITRAQLENIRANGYLPVQVDGIVVPVSLNDLGHLFGYVTDVADNTAKLALTSFVVGGVVRVVGSANRLEMYNGGALNLEASWKVIA